MKQLINPGAAVDDSTGDYLRQGALKINDNFNDIYDELGDQTELHPAGAWKTHTWSQSPTLEPAIGSQYNINSLQGPVSITLPKGSPADYGTVIKIRDVHASWGTNSVTIRPKPGDAVGGSTNPVVFSTDFTSLDFVYSSPATWRYIPNAKIDSLPRAEGAGVTVKNYRVDAGIMASKTFTNISPTGFNPNAVQVYRNGSLLFFDEGLTNSDYGSNVGGQLGALNGIDIFIPFIKLDDVVTIISYSKDVAAAPISYTRYDVEMLSIGNPGVVIPGQSLRVTANGVYTLQDLGRTVDEEFNPHATEIYVNGTLLLEAGKANLAPNLYEDYKLSRDSTDRWNTFTISPELKDGDVLTIVFFNNELGSILEWEGADSIRDRASQIFLNSEYRFNRLNKIRYTNLTEPNATTAVPVPGMEANIRFENVVLLLESIYPVGSIYINANNKANPATYMGFGTWTPYAQGRAIFGFTNKLDNQGNPDPIFGVNPVLQELDGSPQKIAGNEFGSRQFEITAENIPELVSNTEYLRESTDGTGTINLTGCVPDPSDPGGVSPLASYELATVAVNSPPSPGQDPEDVTILPPGITAYIWVRVE